MICPTTWFGQMSQKKFDCWLWLTQNWKDWECLTGPCAQWCNVTFVNQAVQGAVTAATGESRTPALPSLTDWLLRTVTPSRPNDMSHSITVLTHTDTASAPLHQTRSATCHKLTIISPHTSNISDGHTPSAHIWAFSSPTLHAASRCCWTLLVATMTSRSGHMTMVMSYVVVWLDDDRFQLSLLSWLWLDVVSSCHVDVLFGLRKKTEWCRTQNMLISSYLYFPYHHLSVIQFIFINFNEYAWANASHSDIISGITLSL